MDIQKLLNRKSARKEARKTQKKLAKIVKVARTKKVNVSCETFFQMNSYMGFSQMKLFLHF